MKTCIEVAVDLDMAIAVSAFIAASVNGKIITLPLFHAECHDVIKRVTRQQELLGFYEIDKASKQIRFTTSELK